MKPHPFEPAGPGLLARRHCGVFEGPTGHQCGRTREQHPPPPAAAGSERIYSFERLAVALGGSPDSFTGKLLHLIAKSDPMNRRRLRRTFPVQVAAWEYWMARSPAPTFDELDRAVRAYRATWERQTTSPAGVTGWRARWHRHRDPGWHASENMAWALETCRCGARRTVRLAGACTCPEPVGWPRALDAHGLPAHHGEWSTE